MLFKGLLVIGIGLVAYQLYRIERIAMSNTEKILAAAESIGAALDASAASDAEVAKDLAEVLQIVKDEELSDSAVAKVEELVSKAHARADASAANAAAYTAPSSPPEDTPAPPVDVTAPSGNGSDLPNADDVNTNGELTTTPSPTV